MSCPSGENKPKSLKIPDGLEGDRLQQSGDGAASQPEAGKGPQKKPQGKRRDQKGSESLDVQGKPGARGVTPCSRRSPFPNKQQGEKGSDSSVRLRRNASSAGRLQGLSSGSYAGSLGRKECKASEARAPSKKNRPRSLEFTVSSRERALSNLETLLPQEKVKSEHLDSAATSSKVATLDVGATVALEKGSRNPEHSVIMDRGTFRNTPSNVLSDGKETTGEDPEYTALLEKNRIEGSETPKTLGEAVGSELSNPEVPLSSGKKGPQNPEDLVSLGMVTSFYPPLQLLDPWLPPKVPNPFENLLEAVNPEKKNLYMHIFTNCIKFISSYTL